MASDNIVEYVLKINTNKGKVSIKQLSGELKKTQVELIKTGAKGQRSFQKLGASALKAKAAIGSLTSGLMGMGTAVGLLGAGFFALLKTQADYVNQLVDMSARTGIAAEQLAGLKLAAEGSGASFESVERGMDRFLPKLLEVQRGTGRAAELFEQLGVKVEDDVTKKMRDSGDVFNDVIRSLGSMEDQQRANAIAMELFGRQAGGMLIQSGALQSMDDFVSKAKELGPALDENGIRKAQEFQRGWAEVKLGIMSFITALAEGITGEKGIGASLSALAQKLPEWGVSVGKFFQDLWKQIKPIWETLKEAFAFMSDPLEHHWGGGIDMHGILSRISPEYADLTTRGMRLTRGGEIEYRAAGADAYRVDTPAPEFSPYVPPTGGAGGGVDRGGDGSTKTKEEIEKEQVLQDLIRDRIQLLKDAMLPQMRTIFELEQQILKYKKITDGIVEGTDLTKEQILAQENLNAVTQKRDKIIKDGSQEEAKALKNVIDESDEIINSMMEIEKQLAKNEISAHDAKNEMERISDAVVRLQKESGDLDLIWTGLFDLELAKEFDSLIKNIGVSLDDGLGNMAVKIEEAIVEAEKLARTKITLNIATNILEIAGGDIVGGMSGIIDQLVERGTIGESTADLAGGFGSIISGLEQLGESLASAENEALEKHINNLIEAQERATGEKLTDEEIEAIKRGLSTSEIEKIKEEARKDMVRTRLENMAQFISLAISELPVILIEVLPPMLAKLAANIAKSLFKLPVLIIESMGKAVVNWFRWLGEVIVNALKFWKSDDDNEKSYSNLSPSEQKERDQKALEGLQRMNSMRKGGRFISARSGIRFTGMRDQMAQLHRNEFVVSESGAMPQGVKRIMNERGGGGGVVINIHADVVERNAINEIVRKIERQFQDFGTSTSTLFGETA